MSDLDRVQRWSTRLDDVPASSIREIFDRARAMEASGQRVLHAEIGRPDFDTPQVIKDAAAASLAQGNVHYGPNPGLLTLRADIAGFLHDRRGTDYDPDGEVLVTIGANEAILLTMMAFCQPGDEVVIPTPAWGHYKACARLAGATPVEYRLDEDYGIDRDTLRDAIGERTRIVVLCTPGNPTGTTIPPDQIDALVDVLDGTDALLLSDEIYADLIYGEAVHRSPAALPALYERTIVVGGFAKYWAMDGWRLGWLAAPRALAAAALRVRQYTTVCPPTFLQDGARQAFSAEGLAAAEAMRAEFDTRRVAGLEALRSIDGLRLPDPNGAFYFYVTDTTHRFDDARAFALGLLEQEHVAIVPGTAFDANGNHSLRISYATELSDLLEAIERLGAHLEGLHS